MRAINIFFVIIALLKVKTNIEVYIYQAEVGVITAGTTRKKLQDKIVGGLHGRGKHTSLLSVESFHAPSWAPSPRLTSSHSSWDPEAKMQMA